MTVLVSQIIFVFLNFIDNIMGVSKNNPNARKAAIQKKYNDKVVVPVKLISSEFGNVIAAQYENGEIIFDNNGKPIPYKSISAPA
ncbi:MAG: hypothetical protein ACO2XZ_03855 [Rickettsiales bacterium]